MSKKKPTEEFYSLFQFIYDFLNKNLFENELPDCMIVITRKGRTFGYFYPQRWINEEKEKTDEIAINPFFFDKKPLIEILQTMAHEMCHLWQFHLGTPSRRSYHNKEWGGKMMYIGLMPSNTGKPGGKKTGQQMMDYPMKKGLFVKASNKLINQKKFKTLWYDRVNKQNQLNTISLDENSVYNDLDLNEILLEVHHNADMEVYSSKTKSKYKCPSCEISLWGKQGLFIICGNCDQELDFIDF